MRFAFAFLLVSAAYGADAYTPLWLYNGAWKITRPGQSPDKLTNKCALVGRYFTCEQTVNGVAGNLLVIIPATDKPGHYRVQNVKPDGLASARGDLEIDGDRWTFYNTWDQGSGHSTFYRTTNVFSGKNKIHFEQAESSDNKKWTVKSSGDDERIAAGR